MTRVFREPTSDLQTANDRPDATPVGAALVAQAVLRVRLRQVIAETAVARAVADALAAKAARPSTGQTR